MAHSTAHPSGTLRPLLRRLARCALMLAWAGPWLSVGPAWSQGVTEEETEVYIDDGLPTLQLRLSHGLEPAEGAAPVAGGNGLPATGPRASAKDAVPPAAEAASVNPPTAPAPAPAPVQSANAEPARPEPPPAAPARMDPPVAAPAAAPAAVATQEPTPAPAAAAVQAALPAATSAPPAPVPGATAESAAQPLRAEPSRPAPVVQPLNALTALPGVAGSPGLPPEAFDAKGGLSLRHLLEQVVLAHPSVQAARIDIRASAEDRRAQERQRWPSMSALVENKSSNPTIGTTRVLRVEQTLWDAGRVSARINEANTTLNINQARVYITVQQLSLQLVAAWQNLKAAEGRMAVAREALERLAAYRAQMERRVQAEASPPIDLELMLSRILQTEVELNQASNARLQSLTRIEQLASLSGLQQLPWAYSPLPERALVQAQAERLQGIDWLDVARRHPSVEKTRQESLIARQRLDGKRAELYPQLYLRVDRPVGTLNNDVAGFVGFRYTPGAGFATGVEAQALAERAASLEQATEVAVRDVTEAMASDRDELQSNRGRMLALEKAVEGSRAVLESYGRQFIAGRKTWLDLLNAVRELSQNQYALADSHAAMLAALYRLQVRMGEPVQPAP